MEGLVPALAEAMAELLKGYEYARDTGRDIWDFAVEARLLGRLGLNSSDFRWLTCKGYVRHAREVTEPGSKRRCFIPNGTLTFQKRTCFVLTADGVEFCHRLLSGRQATSLPALPGEESPSGAVRPALPSWDAALHELRLGVRLVKRFKWPAMNQETLLAAFQEEGWPIRIDDPLPPKAEQDPKRRLHDTIKSLNRNQQDRLIRFKGDGTGEGARWELIYPFPAGSFSRPTSP